MITLGAIVFGLWTLISYHAALDVIKHRRGAEYINQDILICNAVFILGAITYLIVRYCP